MARVNYAQGKRQRELAAKQKQEEKRQRKAERSAHAAEPAEEAIPGAGDASNEDRAEEGEA